MDFEKLIKTAVDRSSSIMFREKKRDSILVEKKEETSTKYLLSSVFPNRKMLNEVKKTLRS